MISEFLKTRLFLIFTLLLLFFALIYAALFFVRHYVSAPERFPVNQVITIEPGTFLKKVARDFEEKELIRSAFVFETIAWIYQKDKDVKAGEYFFENKINAAELLKAVTANGHKNTLIKITIPEGYSLRDVGRLFEDMAMWPKESFWEITGIPAADCRTTVCVNRQEDFSKLDSLFSQKPSYVSMEGYLFPDTYYVPVDISPDAIVKVMLENFEKKMKPEIKTAVEKSGHSFFEIITMASLLEKEAATEQDRRLISGILWKRFENGMLLQVDAVFPYVIGKNSFQLTMDDLKVDSSYNTYVYKGLPLGPIANPGLESIKAALYPTKSPFWYYLSDKSSNVYYSITYEEHLLKKAKYLTE